MPKFKNTSKKTINVIYNGRKIPVRPNQLITGPVQFKMYSGLTQVSDDDVKVKPKINTDLSHSFNVKKKISNVKKVTRVVKNKNNINMVSIPNESLKDDTSYTLEKEINRTINHLKEYPKTNLPSVAICILSKDSLKLIKDCCNSIIQKVEYPNTRVYILDTGTTDPAVLNYYKQLSKNTSIKFKVMPIGDFHFSKNYNKGIANLKEDYVLIQNNDTVALNDYISELMKIAIVEKVGLTGPRMLYADGRIQHDGQQLFDPSGSRFVNPGHVNLGRNPNQTTRGRHIVDGITAAGVLMRHSWFKTIGGFDESYKDIYQDVELCLQNRMHGKIAVCSRDAVINHYDNTSRKNLWQDKNKILDMHRDHNRLFTKIKRGEIKVNKRNKKDFAIVTLVNDTEQYFHFLESLKKQKTTKSIEVIALPNFNNEYKSASEALNVATDISESKYNIFCHQDIEVPSDWIERIHTFMMSFDQKNINWGVIGMAGSIRYENGEEYGPTYLLNEEGPNKTPVRINAVRENGNYREVQCLDELCMITKNDKSLRFDEEFNHYHLYGADLCLQSLSKNMKNFAIDAPCYHFSDGISNMLNKTHLENYVRASKRLYHKWKAKFKEFRTMTNSFSESRNEMYFFMSEALKKKGIHLPEKLKLK